MYSTTWDGRAICGETENDRHLFSIDRAPLRQNTPVKIWCTMGTNVGVFVTQARTTRTVNDDIKEVLDALAWHCGGWVSRNTGKESIDPGYLCDKPGKHQCRGVVGDLTGVFQCFCLCHVDAHDGCHVV